MKIPTTVLNEFLKKVRLGSGGNSIEEIALDFKEDGVYVNSGNSTNSIVVKGKLNSSVFSDYIPLGKIGIENLDTFMTILNRFKEVNVEKNTESNTLLLSGESKKAFLPLLDVNTLSSPKDVELEFDENFTINCDTLNSFISDAGINKEFIINLETEDKKLVIKNKGHYKFEQDLPINEIKGGTKVSFGNPLGSAIANLGGNILFSISENKPCKIVDKKENYYLTIFVAPYIENKGEQ